MSELSGAKILVTGASGFIGGSLAERLAGVDRAQVTATGRHFSNAARLQAAGVSLATAELRDRDAMARLCEGQQVLCHVAAWLRPHGGAESEAYAINVEATRALAEAAARAGVRRFVLVSSVMAYGIPTHDKVDESTPLGVNQRDVYGRTKAQGELAAREVAARTGIELCIVRPGMVYGPGSMHWTLRLAELVKRGMPVLYGDASGYACPVYIDDVVDILRVVAALPAARGEAFNASDAPISWSRFFDYYGRMCGRQPRRLPLFLAHGVAYANERMNLGLPLTKERLHHYVRKLHYVMDKAERLLSYRVRVPLVEGMRRSEEWLRTTGHLLPH